MFENNNIKDNEENYIVQLMHRYLPYWPLFIVLPIICILGAWAYLQYVTPVYEASATLIIKDEKKGVDDSQILESMNAFTTKKIVENEIEIIRSRAVLNQVVNQLKLYAPVFEEKGLKSYSAYISSPISIELKDPENLSFLEMPAKIYYSFDSLKKEVKIDNNLYPIDKWIKSPYGILKFSLNKEQKKSAANPLYFRLINPKAIVDNLLNNLDVSAASKLSTVVNLKIKDPVPNRGEDILNLIIHSYNQVAIAERNATSISTLSFIEDRIMQVEDELGKIEEEIQQYRSRRGAVDLSEQGRLYLQNVGDYDRKISNINMQLAILEKVEKYVISKDELGGIVPSSLGIEDAVLTQLLDKLYNSEIEYEKLKRTTAENNPVLSSISNEIKKIKPSILENVQNQRISLQASLDNLKSTNQRFQSALQTIPQQERELLEMSRRKTIKNDVFSYLLQKREEAAISYVPSSGDSRVVDTAASSLRPVSPKPLMIYAISIFAALAFSIVYVMAIEMFSDKILYRSEIEKYIKIPVVGELPHVDLKKGQIKDRRAKIFVSEQFREIRVALGLFGKSAHKKKILITSSIEGEGKSFVSKNLALNLASSGKKVLLINFDLRKPISSPIFGLANQNGISEYLAGKLEPCDLVQMTEYKNLYVIPAGQASESSADDLLNVELGGLFASLGNSFDYIIVDTPPVGVATDAYLLSEYCDTTLYVVRHRHTPKNILVQLERNLKIKDLKNINIVFNGVKSRGFFKSGNEIGYGYGQKYQYKEFKYPARTSGALKKA